MDETAKKRYAANAFEIRPVVFSLFAYVSKCPLYAITLQALVAQMDRVLVSEAKGRGFDSRRAHQIYMNVGT